MHVTVVVNRLVVFIKTPKLQVCLYLQMCINPSKIKINVPLVYYDFKKRGGQWPVHIHL